ncbi:MAG: extracellular solute-binding protein [Anaerolineae bacterium]|nr:extracellular solute-binding protein [Anaerolineae bacterium]
MIERCAQALATAFWLCALTACAAPQAFAHSPDVALTRIAQVATVVRSPTPTVTPTPLPSAVNLWFPALFAYESELFTARHFSELVQDYTRQTGQLVTVRLRRAEGLGGIFETLSSAAQVAPSVLPDLVLLRARDLPRAAAARLIVPLSSNTVQEDAYFAAALALARHEGELYGIPYLLELQHAVYGGDELPPLTWQSVISRQLTYLFPAKVTRGVNGTLLSHYITLGGKLSDQNGEPSLDYEPLLSLMDLYRTAYTAGSLSDDVLNYAEPTQYWLAFTASKNVLAQVDSTFFLRQHASSNATTLTAWQFSPLPRIAEGKPPLSLVDGWLWAFTTTNPERQQRALALLEWLQEPTRYALFSQRVSMLPARRAALNAWSEADYAAFAAELLDRRVSPLPDLVNSAVAEALQESFTRLLRDGLSSEEAANLAIDRVRAGRER